MAHEKAFNEIAHSWYGLRHHSIFTSELSEMAIRWQSGTLLNIGCAHGADFIPFIKNFMLSGVDIAENMGEYLQKYSTKHNFTATFTCADMTALPFPDQSFNYAIAIASIHHVQTEAGRLKALQEIHRILKNDGEAFITVWNKDQQSFKDGPKERLIPYRNGPNEISRYYYLFEYSEIMELAHKAHFRVIKIHGEHAHKGIEQESRNICLLLKKEV